VAICEIGEISGLRARENLDLESGNELKAKYSPISPTDNGGLAVETAKA
jgi:hypothetical protein